MNIGEVSERSGLPPKTIRYYEDIGLITPARAENGYRDFAEKDLHKLAFLGRARRSTLFPAFLGLGVVVTMNCLTDSIFQSAVNVQVFMVATLVFLRASDADQPTLAPQKQVSSAAT